MLIWGIALAGGLGALARWGLGLLLVRLAGPRLPFGTLTANLIGCLLLGVALELADRAHWMSAEMRVVVVVGFIGTLTTFSTWEHETYRLARGGEMLLAAGNLAVNVVFGFFLLVAGARLVQLLWR